MGGDPGAGGQEAMVARWHAHQAYGQMSPPGNDLPAVPSPAMHPRSAISQQKYLVVSHCCPCHYHDVLLWGTSPDLFTLLDPSTGVSTGRQ